MLRRTLSSLASEPKSANSDQENEALPLKYESLPQASPNRTKYEAKFMKERRRPLGEKTNKSKNSEGESKKSETGVKGEEKRKNPNNSNNSNSNNTTTTTTNNNNTNNNSNLINHHNSSNYEHNSSSSSDSSFQDLFHLNPNNHLNSSSLSHGTTSKSSSSSAKIEELSTALSETLKENEQLHDTVSLLKAEIGRLNEELVEYREYAELYLLGKELIENQAEEIENLKKKLVKTE